MPNICAFATCQRRNKEHPDLVMHRFPHKHPEIREQWVINSGNLSLINLPPEKLKNRYICSMHFLEDDFMDPLSKKRLKPFAVPVSYLNRDAPATLKRPLYVDEELDCVSEMDPSNQEEQSVLPQAESEQNVAHEPHLLRDVINLQDETRRKDYEHFFFVDEEVMSHTDSTHDFEDEKCINSVTEFSTTHPETDGPKMEKLKLRVKDQRREIKNKSSQVLRLKERVKQLKESCNLYNFIENHKFPSENSKALVRMQFKIKKGQWCGDEKKLSIALYTKSPSMYEFLIAQKIVLPGASSVRRWMNS